MSNQQPIQVGVATLMQEMATLTSRREEKELAYCLLELSFQFMSVDRIALYAVRQRQDQLQIRQEAARPACYDTGHHDWHTPPLPLARLIANASNDNLLARIDDRYWQCVRKRNQVVAIIALHAATLSENDQLFLSGMVRLQENHLRLLYDAERDMLTGLRNRRTFDAKLFELLERRSGQETLAIVDIDFFKRINDQFGHIMGDEVLLLLARKMEDALGEQALLYRYGGEEFAIILLDEPDTAQQRLDSLRQQVADHAMPQIGNITISIGHAPITQQSLPPNLIEEADKALYFAKGHGRNCVYSHTVLQQAGLIAPPLQHHGEIELF